MQKYSKTYSERNVGNLFEHVESKKEKKYSSEVRDNSITVTFSLTLICLSILHVSTYYLVYLYGY